MTGGVEGAAPSWMDLGGAALLFWMMFVVGLGLAVDDFRRVAAYPRAVVYGTVAQWTLLPLCAGLLLLACPAPPHVAAGVVLLTAAPGGGISNVFVFLAKANTALSVSLTAISSLLAVVTLPIVTALGFQWVVGEEQAIEVPVVAMIGQLAALVLLPIGLGMWLHARRPDLAARWGVTLRRTVLIALVVLLAAGMSTDSSGLLDQVVTYLALGLAWTLMAMALGLAIGFALRPTAEDRFTFLIEFSVKNVGLMAIVALAGFERPDFAVFAGSYLVIGYPMAGAAVWAFRRNRLAAEARMAT
jgi:BASS family bile acid:Na+ symporter